MVLVASHAGLFPDTTCRFYLTFLQKIGCLTDRLGNTERPPARKVRDEHLLGPPHINKTDHILDSLGTLYRAANLQGLDE